QLLHSLHFTHAGDLAHANEDAIQVLQVGNVGDDVHRGALVGRLGFHVANVGVGVTDDGSDLLQHAGTVVAGNDQLHRIPCLPVLGRGIVSPLHGDAPLRLQNQVGDV